jgi:hypothetical protein
MHRSWGEVKERILAAMLFTGTAWMSLRVKVCGCRPHEGVAAYTAGPAYANLQGREPREMWQGQASDAMGISARAVCCQGALNACLGSGRRRDETVRPVANGVTGVAQRGARLKLVVVGGARASLIDAGREPAKQKGRAGVSPRIDFDHDVSILITAVDAAGR